MNFSYIFKQRLLIFLASVIVFSCSNPEQADWDKSLTTDTKEAYQEYIEKYPEGAYQQEANDKIQEFYLKEAEVADDPIAVYNNYKTAYPQGTYDQLFETIIYNYTILKNDISFFEEYVTLFPEGKYLGEFETLIYNNIINGESSLTLTDYIERFPDGVYTTTIDSLMYDSLFIKNSLQSIQQYVDLFPENPHQTELDSLKEEITYSNLLRSNSSNDFKYFINNYPETEKLAILHISGQPDNANVVVKDNKGNEFFKAAQLPIELKVIKGTNLNVSATAEKFHAYEHLYSVNEDSVQNFTFSMESANAYIYIDEFEDPTSTWAESTGNYQFVLDNNGHLVCQTRERQLQVLKNIPVNYKENFTIEIKFSISSVVAQYLSYFGILWGNEYQLKYFFISSDGHRNIGSQEDDLRSPSNENGYSRWITSFDEIGTWPLASTFNEGGYNVIKIENKNKTVSYKINGQTIFQENIKTPRDNSFGLGIGNANVIVDYIKVYK